jgi:regulator of sirC expression with transglutaminase-like and TPR domain
MTDVAAVRARFAAAVHRPDDAIDLAEAALLIAAESFPELDIARYMGALDELARTIAPALDACDTDGDRVRRLVEFLALECRFRGNQADYYDRRNSFLNEVLDRRTGIPITLTLVYTEVARRVRLPLLGVGFPGHFLAKLPGPQELIVDAFQGRIVTIADCVERLQAAFGRDVRLAPDHLRAATRREILVRMLHNLKQIYVRARDPAAALACSERVLLVEPNLADEFRDRGLLYAQLECYAAARDDLERFLALAPDHPTAPAIRERVVELRRKGVTTLH